MPRKPTQAKKRKNVDHEEMQGQVGKVFMPQQDLGEVNLRKAKGDSFFLETCVDLERTGMNDRRGAL